MYEAATFPLPPAADPAPALAPAPAFADPAAAPLVQPELHRFTFTGSGKEYFRIWMVNLFLTVATLGLYSAWAKVRRLQYFDRNTELAGAVFDFDGDPRAILRGRVLAVVLLGAYQYAFGFSVAVGVAVVLALLLALPFLMRGALRFRLGNTRYRGLRFGFSGSAAGAYPAYFPPVLMFLLPAALVAVDPSQRSVLVIFLFYLAWPLMHGTMKRYQHKHLQFGELASSFDVPKRRFYIPYLKSLGMGLLAMALAMALGALLIYLHSRWTGATGADKTGAWFSITITVVMGYVAYLMAGPYLQVRVGNLVWSATTFPGMTINSHMKARAYMKLQLINSILTLLSLGLYRPFAVVRAYRYRLAHISVSTTDGFERVLAGVSCAGSASADGVADFLGVDLSW
jgi:uncharacterized membrane protein YjgN (DUF898 family)